MKRIVLVGSPKKPEAAAVIAELTPWLAQRASVVTGDPLRHGELADLGQVDLVLSFGGDGTLLGLARQLAERRLQVPVMGVNLGRLGYMAEFSVAELHRHFDSALAGRLPVRTRSMLTVCVEPVAPVSASPVSASPVSASPVSASPVSASPLSASPVSASPVSASPLSAISGNTGSFPAAPTATRFSSYAFNDVVVNAGPSGRMISLEVRLEDRLVTTVGGDGLLVATPTGSTAYNLAAGGPIIQPVVSALAITPICAHTLNHRPIVISDRLRIEIRHCRVSDANPPVSQVVLDGQVNRPLNFSECVKIARADYDLLLVENPDRSSFDTLRDKLNWGVGPI